MSIKKRGGFTLMEVLIYAGILSITGTILSGVLLNTTRIKSRQTAVIEVNEQLTFVLQNIQRSIIDSSIIDIDSGTSTSTLVLKFKDDTKNPTKFYIADDKVYKKIADDAAQPLTDDSVVADAINFLKVSGYSGHDSVQIDLTLSYNTGNPASTFSRTLSSAVARVSAATFDSNLIPGSGTFYDIGTTALPWNNAYLGGKLGIGTTDPTAQLHLSTTGGTDAFVIGSTTTQFIVNKNGNVAIGTTEDDTFKFKVSTTGNAFGFERYVAAGGGAIGYFRKSRSATVGTNEIVQNGDTFGQIAFSGANGTGYTNGAIINATVDGVPGASSDMPGAIKFWTTPDGSGTAVERMKIDNAGNVGINTVSPTTQLLVSATDKTTPTVYMAATSTAMSVYVENSMASTTLSSPSLGFTFNNFDYLQINPSSASSYQIDNRYGLAYIPLTNSSTITGSILGSYDQVINMGSGAVTTLYGQYGQASNGGAGGTVTNLRGVQANAGNIAPITGLNQFSTTTNATALFAQSTNSTTNGLITNQYGVWSYVTNSGTITNSYGFYASGWGTGGTHTNTAYDFYGSDTAAWNYFGGSVGIGTTAPGVLLHLKGSGSSAEPANSGTTPTGKVRFDDASNIAIDFGSINSSPYPAWIQVHDSSNQATNYPLVLNPNGGNVGIGTTNPNYTLRVRPATDVNFGVRAYSATTPELLSFTDAVTLAPMNIEASPLSLNARIGGYVGIGMTDPSVALDVTGDIEYTGTITDVSDKRLKENFEKIVNPLGIINGLYGLKFNMIGSNVREVGLIAQDVQKVLPEAVRIVDSKNGYLGVSYPSLIPLMIEGIKEQQKQIEDLKAEVAELKLKIK